MHIEKCRTRIGPLSATFGILLHYKFCATRFLETWRRRLNRSSRSRRVGQDGGIEGARPSATVSVLASSFRPGPTTYFVVLAWLREEGLFHDEFLLIPSEDLRDVAREDAYGHLKFEFHPGSATMAHLKGFRLPRATLGAAIEGVLSLQSLG
jgi:hypothetical protein